MTKKTKQPRKTKTAGITSIRDGILYFEDKRQCALDDEAFEEIISYEKAIRIESLAASYYTHEYLSGVGFANFDLRVEMTLRVEIRNGGTRHWYAYRRAGGHLQKRYVGQDDKVTTARILEVARHMA